MQVLVTLRTQLRRSPACEKVTQPISFLKTTLYTALPAAEESAIRTAERVREWTTPSM